MNLNGMTQERWNLLTPHKKDKLRDNSDLIPALVGWEGWCVEVVDHEGETRRFIIGRSTGWKPIHLEIKTKRSRGGDACDRRGYHTVRPLYRAR